MQNRYHFARFAHCFGENMHEVLSLFPSQVLRVTWPDAAEFAPGLIAEVLQLRQQLPSASKTNVGGWHSPSVLQERPEPAISRFVSQIPAHLSVWAQHYFAIDTPLDPSLWQLEVWANCNETGHFNKAHDHFRSGVVVSGFYYLRCGGDDVGGETVFINQQSCPLNIHSPVPLREQSFSVTPQDGDMYIFPSWLGHRVNPYRGSATRISLAFNASHPALQVVKKTDKPRFSAIRKILRKIS
jgi:uncharacterized protein (TIGR02466 family)